MGPPLHIEARRPCFAFEGVLEFQNTLGVRALMDDVAELLAELLLLLLDATSVLPFVVPPSLRREQLVLEDVRFNITLFEIVSHWSALSPLGGMLVRKLACALRTALIISSDRGVLVRLRCPLIWC